MAALGFGEVVQAAGWTKEQAGGTVTQAVRWKQESLLLTENGLQVVVV